MRPTERLAGAYKANRPPGVDGNVVRKVLGESAKWNLGKPKVLLNDEWTGHETV